jgi:hypothetical protein
LKKTAKEDLHNLYSSPNIIRLIKSGRMIWAWHVARTGEAECSRILEGKSEGKRPLGIPRRMWEDNVKLISEIGWGGMYWIELVQDRDQ